jgi:hypothetical protein
MKKNDMGRHEHITPSPRCSEAHGTDYPYIYLNHVNHECDQRN